MKIVVTGGAGFIGSHVVDAFKQQQHDILVVDNFSTGRRGQVPESVKLHEGNVESPATAAAIRTYRPQAVVHLAAQLDVMTSVAKPEFDAEVNVLGTVNVLQAAKEAGAAVFVFASSGG